MLLRLFYVALILVGLAIILAGCAVFERANRVEPIVGPIDHTIPEEPAP